MNLLKEVQALPKDEKLKIMENIWGICLLMILLNHRYGTKKN